MRVSDLLNSIRASYLTEFARHVESLSADETLEVISEAALRGADGELLREGTLGLPVRSDIVLVRGDEAVDMVMIDMATMLAFDPVEFVWERSLVVTLHPFQWNSCSFLVAGPSRRARWAPLTAWFSKWFDEDDSADADEQGFYCVVHYLSDPVRQGATWLLTIDFGSASIEAFEELLDCLARVGATKVVVSAEVTGG